MMVSVVKDDHVEDCWWRCLSFIEGVEYEVAESELRPTSGMVGRHTPFLLDSQRLHRFLLDAWARHQLLAGDGSFNK